MRRLLTPSSVRANYVTHRGERPHVHHLAAASRHAAELFEEMKVAAW